MRFYIGICYKTIFTVWMVNMPTLMYLVVPPGPPLTVAPQYSCLGQNRPHSVALLIHVLLVPVRTS